MSAGMKIIDERETQKKKQRQKRKNKEGGQQKL